MLSLVYAGKVLKIVHFMTKKFRVSVIVIYAPLELTDGDISDSDEFYLQLQEQIDWVPGRNMVFFRRF